MNQLWFPTIPFVLLSILSFVYPAASNCYCVLDGNVFDCSGTETTCGTPSSVDSGAQLCCVTGDQCGKDSICHFKKQIANTSGYYLGGCTDPTYKDPVCQQHCTDAGTADIVFNSATGLWSCCGYPNGTVSCQNPRSDTTFQAIALNDFPGTTSILSSSTTSTSLSISTSSSTSTTSSSSASGIMGTAGSASAINTSTVSQNSSSGLNTGATAGIAVAAVLVGLGMIAGLTFILMRRRRRVVAEADSAAAANMPGYFNPAYNSSSLGQAAEMSEMYTPMKDPKTALAGYPGSRSPGTVHESDARPVPAQLYGSETNRGLNELP